MKFYRQMAVWCGILCALHGNGSADETRRLAGHRDAVYALAFHPAGNLLASGSYDETVKLWAWPSGQELASLEGHEDQVYRLAFSADGTMLASCSADGTVRVWDVARRELKRVLRGHDAPVLDVAFASQPSLVASVGYDGKVRTWDAHTGKALQVLHHDGPLAAVAFSLDGKQLWTGGVDAQMRRWDRETAQCEETFGQPATAVVYAIAISDDGRWIAAVDSRGTLVVRDTKLETWLKPAENDLGALFAAVFARRSDGRLVLVTAGRERAVRIWSIPELTTLARLAGPQETVLSLAVSPDGKHAVAGCYDAAILVWDIDLRL